MARTELIEKILRDVSHPSLTKAALTEMVGDVFDLIELEVIEHGSFTITGFGTWVIKNSKERKGCNPNTHQPILIPACKRIKFKPSQKLVKRLK